MHRLVALIAFMVGISFAQLGLPSAPLELGDKDIFTVDTSTCPAGDVAKGLSTIVGGYECIDFKGVRWIRAYDAGLRLYKPLDIKGDFSVSFNFYAFEPGCPYVLFTLFPEETLNQAKSKYQYALTGKSLISVWASCSDIAAGISSTPVDARNLKEYTRNLQNEKVYKIAITVRNGRASIYLDGKKIASEPFNPQTPIKGLGLYFYRKFATDKPFGEYPALVGNLKVSLYTGKASAPARPAVSQNPPPSMPKAREPQVSSPTPQMPPMPAMQPVPQARRVVQTSVPRGSAKCIESVGVGEASVIGGDRSGAKVEATARAKWDAIEKALGVTTSVKTILHNFALLDEVIKNEVGGFIRDVKVLSVDNFQDMVRVKVKGCVYPKEAEKALSLISSDTSFSVMIVTKNPGSVVLDEMNPVTTELVNILNQQGFKVYDFAGNPNINPYDIENIIAQRRFIALRAYMSRVLSGAMIVGKVELVPSTQMGQDIGYGIKSSFNVVTARLNYYLLTRDNQGLRIVASGSVSALGRALNQRDAEYKAMEALAKRVGADIMGKIEKYRASKSKLVTVTVKGVRSTKTNFRIKEKLQRVPWVESVEDAGLGKFRVKYLENTVYLANAVERIPELRLISFNATEVVAKYR